MQQKLQYYEIDPANHKIAKRKRQRKYVRHDAEIKNTVLEFDQAILNNELTHERILHHLSALQHRIHAFDLAD